MSWPIDWLFTKGPGYDWTVGQSNQQYFRLMLNPTERVHFGDGLYAQNFDGHAVLEHQAGRVSFGRTVRKDVEFTITWDDDKRGEYRGTLHDDGRLRGVTREGNGEYTVTWWNHDNHVKWAVPGQYETL